MAELGKQGRTDPLHFEPPHEGDAPPVIDDVPMQLRPGGLTDVHLLPHLSLHELDIQGHQSGTPEDLCPGQMRENVPETGLFLYCWGRKP